MTSTSGAEEIKNYPRVGLEEHPARSTCVLSTTPFTLPPEKAEGFQEWAEQVLSRSATLLDHVGGQAHRDRLLINVFTVILDY